MAKLNTGAIRVGIGGWTFAPWRGRFYPADLPKTQELHYASRQLTAIEINGTFYRTQSPESFARWAAETPDGFLFALKAQRGATYKKDPAERAESIDHFLGSGITQLGSKLGPILWQFPATRRFDAGNMALFLQALPPKQDGLALRHVVEAAHPSFIDPAWTAMLREHGVARAMVEKADEPLAELTADFLYMRLERNADAAPEGYDSDALDGWATRLRGWAAGDAADEVARDCFVFFIGGDKQRAPDAARAMLTRLGDATDPG